MRFTLGPKVEVEPEVQAVLRLDNSGDLELTLNGAVILWILKQGILVKNYVPADRAEEVCIVLEDHKIKEISKSGTT